MTKIYPIISNYDRVIPSSEFLHFTSKQVSVEPPPSAVNVTLPAILLLSASACSTTPPQLSIDISCQQLTRRPRLLLLIDAADRLTGGPTDARPLHRLYASSVKKISRIIAISLQRLIP